MATLSQPVSIINIFGFIFTSINPITAKLGKMIDQDTLNYLEDKNDFRSTSLSEKHL